ncbi:BLUF domain-containing protein [Flavobacterium sp.]|uniref:BLUF domain-containing protein n=1 Tax=Flavobacterium sp. TaxID=239 RepID=UPI003D287BAA
MHRIIYLSSAIELFTDEEINLLLQKSRFNNAQKNITGLLLYSEGNFIQILEGNKDEIQNTFEKIKLDNRHKNIITVINEPIKKRTFSDWKMGYSLVDPTFLNNHPEINPFRFKNNTSIDLIVKTFIETFLNSFRNQVLYT